MDLKIFSVYLLVYSTRLDMYKKTHPNGTPHILL